MEIARFSDDIWPDNGINQQRCTVRAILINQNNEYGFIHIVSEDEFGKRDHLETIGGGIEENETKEEALKREIKEESGFNILSFKELGVIIDTYNLLKRETVSTFFVVHVDTKNISETKLTDREKLLFKEIIWLSEKDALETLKETKCDIGKLVQQRDLAAFAYYLNHKSDFTY